MEQKEWTSFETPSKWNQIKDEKDQSENIQNGNFLFCTFNELMLVRMEQKGQRNRNNFFSRPFIVLLTVLYWYNRSYEFNYRWMTFSKQKAFVAQKWRRAKKKNAHITNGFAILFSVTSMIPREATAIVTFCQIHESEREYACALYLLYSNLYVDVDKGRKRKRHAKTFHLPRLNALKIYNVAEC